MNFMITLFITSLIAISAILGDRIEALLDNRPLIKALCDNVTHLIIGGLSWFLCYLNRYKTAMESRNGIVEVMGCAFIASIIDVDHFVAANSFKIKEVTKLPYRPFLHCSTIPLTLFLVLMTISLVTESFFLKKWALIMLTAFATHHIRDATRRGLWLFPFGSTQPIPYWFYVFLSCAVPYFIILLDRVLKIGTIYEPLSHSYEI